MTTGARRKRNPKLPSESQFQNDVRLYVSAQGGAVFRNNVGAMYDADSRRLVRYGLANDSRAMNLQLKSSDLIGWCGDGRFLSIECKAPGWQYRGTSRERAQLKWIEHVRRCGGRAGFAQSLEDVYDILKQEV